MSSIDGCDLYKKVKEMDINTKICFLTAGRAFNQQSREKDYSQLSRGICLFKNLLKLKNS